MKSRFYASIILNNRRCRQYVDPIIIFAEINFSEKIIQLVVIKTLFEAENTFKLIEMRLNCFMDLLLLDHYYYVFSKS